MIPQWNCVQKTNKLPSTWLRTKSLTLTVAQERNAHMYVDTVCRGVKLCPRKNQPFKYRCLIKVRSCELGFLLCYVRAFEPGSHRNQHVTTLTKNIYTSWWSLDSHITYLVNCSGSQLEDWGERFLRCSCSRHLKKKIPCQITLV